MKPIVEVKNLIKNYGEKEAVKSVSFKINEDEINPFRWPDICFFKKRK